MVVFFHGFRYLVHKPSSFIVVRTAYKVVSTPAAIRSARIVRATVVVKVLFHQSGDGFPFAFRGGCCSRFRFPTSPRVVASRTNTSQSAHHNNRVRVAGGAFFMKMLHCCENIAFYMPFAKKAAAFFKTRFLVPAHGYV